MARQLDDPIPMRLLTVCWRVSWGFFLLKLIQKYDLRFRSTALLVVKTPWEVPIPKISASERWGSARKRSRGNSCQAGRNRGWTAGKGIWNELFSSSETKKIQIIQTKRLALSPLVTVIDSARGNLPKTDEWKCWILENSETPEVFIIENPENSKYLRLSMYSTIFFVLFLVLMTAFFLWLRSRRLKQREVTLQMPQLPPTKISITPESLNAF